MGMGIKKSVKYAAALAAVVSLSLVSNSAIGAVLFEEEGTGNNGESLSASASFEIVGLELQITLTNTGTYDPSDPEDILAGVLFNIAGDPTLSRIAVELAAGSTVTDGGTTDGGNVGGEFGYKSGINSFGANQVVSSVGALVGADNVFPGANLAGPGSPNGIQYGITTLFDAAANDNGGIVDTAFIANSVVIRLGNLPEGFSLDDISNVSFAYGTDHSIVIPEPTGFVLTLGGMGLFAMIRRRRS